MNRGYKDAAFSRNSDEWETPQDLFDQLDAEFHFDIDACATKDNAKCENFWTKEDNALLQYWGGVMFFAIHPIARLRSLWRKHSMRAG